MGELIFRIANRELGHPSMQWIANNRSLVEILAYRHYQRHGGLQLPPREGGLAAMQAHQDAVAAAFQANPRVNPDELPRVNFPPWRQPAGPTSPTTAPATPSTRRGALEPSSPVSPPVFQGRDKGKGKGGPNPGQMGGNIFGPPGQGRPPRGPPPGGAGGVGIGA